MAATKGHGNPNWTEDETILALDLYMACAPSMPGPTDPRVIELSTLLRDLPTHDASTRKERFRNPAGVAFKLQNLRQVATGSGLSNTSTTDRAVWARFGGDQVAVAKIAGRLRAQAAAPTVASTEVVAVPDDEVFPEGRVLTAVHRVRERDKRLRVRLIATREAVGPLICECCGDGPKLTVDQLAHSGFEAHHRVPLADANGSVRNTKIDDLALLCATCHRILHRAIHAFGRWVSVSELSQMIRPGPK